VEQAVREAAAQRVYFQATQMQSALSEGPLCLPHWNIYTSAEPTLQVCFTDHVPPDEHFKRWFGSPSADDITSIQNTFKNMWDDGASTAATAISKMVLDRKDFGNHCDTDKWFAYTDPPSGRFHICPKTLALKQQSETQCADFDAAEHIYYPAARTISFVLLHEMTHFDAVADDRLGLIEDWGKGPRACFALDDEQKQTNANNYAFEAAVGLHFLVCFTSYAPWATNLFGTILSLIATFLPFRQF
jgi:hypothetical protein